MTTVDFDKAKLTRLKAALAKHRGDDHPFEFEGHTYIPSYAKYLVEYLETRFGSKS